jgi:triosephosphate isomerase (TIM)
MTQRTPLIAGNWKLNRGAADGCELATLVAAAAQKAPKVDVVVAPPFTALAAVAQSLDEAQSKVEVSAQNLYPKDSGAFTGEISAPMIVLSGAKWVILGHSERRQYFAETDAFIREKIEAALKAGLRPIACVGETLAEREGGKTLEVVFRQVDAFADLLKANPGFGVVAYEPVWAIGTGKVATPEQAQEVHAAIRARLAEKAGADVASKTRILYGGSVKGSNADELLRSGDIDGALVGGASLEPEGFGQIIAAAQKLAAS